MKYETFTFKIVSSHIRGHKRAKISRSGLRSTYQKVDKNNCKDNNFLMRFFFVLIKIRSYHLRLTPALPSHKKKSLKRFENISEYESSKILYI